MHKHVTHNRCHPTFADFKAAILTFLSDGARLESGASREAHPQFLLRRFRTIVEMQAVGAPQYFPLWLGVVGCVGWHGYCSPRKRNNPSADDSTRRSGVLPTHCTNSFMV